MEVCILCMRYLSRNVCSGGQLACRRSNVVLRDGGLHIRVGEMTETQLAHLSAYEFSRLDNTRAIMVALGLLLKADAQTEFYRAVGDNLIRRMAK